MKTIGVTGYKGRLGSYLLSHYPNYVGLDCDVRNPEQVRSSIKSSQVDTVLHLAAISDVDFCEKPENAQLVSDVNLRGTFNVCRATEDVGMEVILLSSDHVFSGKWGKYKEHNKPNPVNYYGFSKLCAEGLQVVFDNLRIVRTSYLFNDDRLKTNIFNIQNRLLINNHYPTFICRSFMYLPHFINSIIYYIERIEKMPKLLHIAGYHSVSWYEFMKYWCEINDIDKRFIIPKKKDQNDLFAPRPKKVKLDVSLSRKLGFPQFSYIQGLLQMRSDSL